MKIFYQKSLFTCLVIKVLFFKIACLDYVVIMDTNIPSNATVTTALKECPIKYDFGGSIGEKWFFNYGIYCIQECDEPSEVRDYESGVCKVPGDILAEYSIFRHVAVKVKCTDADKFLTLENIFGKSYAEKVTNCVSLDTTYRKVGNWLFPQCSSGELYMLRRDNQLGGCAGMKEVIEFDARNNSADPVVVYNKVIIYKCQPGYVMIADDDMVCKEWQRDSAADTYYELWNVMPGGVYQSPCSDTTQWRDPANNYECTSDVPNSFQGLAVPACTQSAEEFGLRDYYDDYKCKDIMLQNVLEEWIQYTDGGDTYIIFNDNFIYPPCKKAQYWDPILQCEWCPPLCSACLTYDICSECIDGYKEEGGSCILDCPKGKFLTDSETECRDCSPNCDECPSPDQCFICALGYRLLNGECYPECPNKDCTKCLQEGCIKCSTPLEGDCLICKDGFYLDNGFCFECNSQCARCDGPAKSNCINCIKRYNGECLKDCPATTYNISGECYDCPTGCDSCIYQDNQLTCLSCKNQYQLTQDQTPQVCEGICEQETCIQCNLQLICEQCGNDTVLFQGYCYEKGVNPDKYFQVEINDTIYFEPCEIDCEDCIPEFSKLVPFDNNCYRVCPKGSERRDLLGELLCTATGAPLILSNQVRFNKNKQQVFKDFILNVTIESSKLPSYVIWGLDEKSQQWYPNLLNNVNLTRIPLLIPAANLIPGITVNFTVYAWSTLGVSEDVITVEFSVGIDVKIKPSLTPADISPDQDCFDYYILNLGELSHVASLNYNVTLYKSANSGQKSIQIYENQRYMGAGRYQIGQTLLLKVARTKQSEDYTVQLDIYNDLDKSSYNLEFTTKQLSLENVVKFIKGIDYRNVTQYSEGVWLLRNLVKSNDEYFKDQFKQKSTFQYRLLSKEIECSDYMDCNNRGTCQIDEGGDVQCECQEGYKGDSCEINISEEQVIYYYADKFLDSIGSVTNNYIQVYRDISYLFKYMNPDNTHNFFKDQSSLINKLNDVDNFQKIFEIEIIANKLRFYNEIQLSERIERETLFWEAWDQLKQFSDLMGNNLDLGSELILTFPHLHARARSFRVVDQLTFEPLFLDVGNSEFRVAYDYKQLNASKVQEALFALLPIKRLNDYATPIIYKQALPLEENNLHSEELDELIIIADMEQKIAGVVPKTNVTLRTLERLDDQDDIECFALNISSPTNTLCEIVFRSNFLIRCSCPISQSNTFFAQYKQRVYALKEYQPFNELGLSQIVKILSSQYKDNWIFSPIYTYGLSIDSKSKINQQIEEDYQYLRELELQGIVTGIVLAVILLQGFIGLLFKSIKSEKARKTLRENPTEKQEEIDYFKTAHPLISILSFDEINGYGPRVRCLMLYAQICVSALIAQSIFILSDLRNLIYMIPITLFGHIFYGYIFYGIFIFLRKKVEKLRSTGIDLVMASIVVLIVANALSIYIFTILDSRYFLPWIATFLIAVVFDLIFLDTVLFLAAITTKMPKIFVLLQFRGFSQFDKVNKQIEEEKEFEKKQLSDDKLFKNSKSLSAKGIVEKNESNSAKNAKAIKSDENEGEINSEARGLLQQSSESPPNKTTKIQAKDSSVKQNKNDKK